MYTYEPEAPPVHVTVTPLARVIAEMELELVQTSGLVYATETLNAPTCVPPEPLNV